MKREFVLSSKRSLCQLPRRPCIFQQYSGISITAGSMYDVSLESPTALGIKISAQK